MRKAETLLAHAQTSKETTAERKLRAVASEAANDRAIVLAQEDVDKAKARQTAATAKAAKTTAAVSTAPAAPTAIDTKVVRPYSHPWTPQLRTH